MTGFTLADELKRYEFGGFSCHYSRNASSQLPDQRDVQEHAQRREQRHAQVEIIVPFENSDVFATWTAGDRNHQASLSFGQICIIPPEQRHRIHPRISSEIMFIHLPTRTVLESTQGALRSLNWKLSSECAVSDATVVTLAKELKQWLTREDAIAALYRRTIIRLISVHIIAKYAQVDLQLPAQPIPRPEQASASNAKLTPVVHYIQGHLDQNLKVKNLAKLAGLSQSHFSRMFKRSVGLTPHQYILSQRIQRAKTLLYNPQISLSEISFQCGFYDQSHFILQFRRFVGVTPKSYREKSYGQIVYTEDTYTEKACGEGNEHSSIEDSDEGDR